MSQDEMYPIRITTPWPGQRYLRALTAAILSCSAIASAAYLTYAQLPPLQHHYLGVYFGSTFTPTSNPHTYDLLSITRKGQVLMATDDQVRLQDGDFHLIPGLTAQDDRLQWTQARIAPHALAAFLQQTVYHGLSPFQVFRGAILLVFLTPLFVVCGSVADRRYVKNLAKGRVRRGPRLLPLPSFNDAMKPADGITFLTVQRHHGLIRLFRGPYHLQPIAIPQSQECNHHSSTGTPEPASPNSSSRSSAKSTNAAKPPSSTTQQASSLPSFTIPAAAT